MLRDELSVLAAFAVVADERLGVRLLARTTRTVAPTDAGQRLLAKLRPALDGIEAALTEVGHLRDRPAGVVRLIAPPVAIAMAVSSKLANFARDYPDVVLDITTEDDSGPTWSPAASTPASTSASSSSATWWP